MVTATIIWLLVNALCAFVELLRPPREMGLRITYLVYGLVNTALAFGLIAA